MELKRTIKAKVVALTTIKREALEVEYANYQKAVRLSEETIENLGIKTLKQAGELLYDEDSEYSLKRHVLLYSAAYQLAFKRVLCSRKGKSKKEQPLRLRNDTFDVRKTENEIATYWSKIPVYGIRGGINVALKMSPKHEELLQDSEIKICDSELLKRDNDFYLHITVKKCIDITPKRSSKLAVIGIDAGIRNTAVSVVWSNDRITGVKMHSGRKLEHKVKQAKARLAKSHRHAFKHNDYYCAERALNKETEIGQKLSNYTKDYLHKLSSQIVEKAIELRTQGYDVLIACEDLKRIRDRISGKLQWWAFRKLLDFVKYKAAWEGILCIKVQPANTSRICPKCRSCSNRNRNSLNFICTECKYNTNSDLVGATNVATRSLASHELNALGKGRHESVQEVTLAMPQAMRPGQTQIFGL